MLCKKTVEIGDSYGDTAAGGSYKKLHKQFLTCFEENEKMVGEKKAFRKRLNTWNLIFQ